jgi:hypothetical protein
MRRIDAQSERERRRMERHARQQERVADAGNCCYLCGEDNPVCLQVHHVFGRTNDTQSVVCVCQNCHAKHSDRQQDYSPGLLSHRTPTTRKRRNNARLRGTADCLFLMAETLLDMADEDEFEGDEDDE